MHSGAIFLTFYYPVKISNLKTHIMEVSQGNSLYSYLEQTKMSFFFLNWRIGGRTGPVGMG
jgi:hypothetical protein